MVLHEVKVALIKNVKTHPLADTSSWLLILESSGSKWPKDLNH
jgi:hypothetical protein